ncbi:MAG: lytic transglycosylase protein [Clostridiales bacterium]|nr:lytic transglycosylase protein [Clostridiales bacterium]
MTRRIFVIMFVIVFSMIILVNYKPILKKIFPLQYNQSVMKYSAQYDMDPYLIYSIIRVESKFNPYAKSNKGATGLMQITPQTGMYIAELLNIDSFDENQLYNPDLNIQFGSFYFSKLYKDFNADINCALAAYNGGSGNVTKWITTNDKGEKYLDVEKIPFNETRNYILRVKKIYNIYNFLYKT